MSSDHVSVRPPQQPYALPIVSTEPVIESVVFRDETDPSLSFLGPGKCTVVARLSDGSTVEVLCFYADEHRYSEGSFAGLTPAQAVSRHHAHDVAYLQS